MGAATTDYRSLPSPSAPAPCCCCVRRCWARSVAWDKIKYADMHAKGIQLVFKYVEGFDLDFDIGLYFYEQLCKFCEDPKNKEWLVSEAMFSFCFCVFRCVVVAAESLWRALDVRPVAADDDDGNQAQAGVAREGRRQL